MEEALRFFHTYEIWIYLILGFVGLLYVRKFILAWQELRSATFGLERESAQGRLNKAATILIFLMALAMSEFVLVSLIVPSVPEALPLLTPTIDLLATPTITLPPTASEAAVVAGQLVATPTLPGTPAAQGNGCITGQASISAPQDGTEVRGTVDILGTVNLPNFGFYKIGMRPPGIQDWQTILAGNEIKQEALLGSWNTSLITPGDYELGLIVVDNQGNELQPCTILVHIASSAETPQP